MMYGLLLLWVIISLGAELSIANLWDFNENFIVFTPARLKKYYPRMGKWSFWLIFIVFRFINPVGTIGKFIHYILQ